MKKWLNPRKNLQWKKIFDFEIFVLKYVSKHSESIPIKKNSTKIFRLCHFFTILAKKWLSPRKNFVMEKIFDCVILVLKYVSKHSDSIPTKNILTTENFWLCHFFTIFWPKNHVFRGFWGQKNFRKNFFCASF